MLNAGEPTLQFFVQLRQQGLQPNVVTFRAVVGACWECQVPQRVLQIFEAMQQQGLELNVISYPAVASPGGVTLQLSDRIRQQGL